MRSSSMRWMSKADPAANIDKILFQPPPGSGFQVIVIFCASIFGLIAASASWNIFCSPSLPVDMNVIVRGPLELGAAAAAATVGLAASAGLAAAAGASVGLAAAAGAGAVVAAAA